MSFMSKISQIFGSSSSVAASASSKVAKERLSVILASQRGSELLDGVDMQLLQQDVLAVVQVCLLSYFDSLDGFYLVAIELL